MKLSETVAGSLLRRSIKVEIGWGGTERSRVGILQRRWLLVYTCFLLLSNGCAKKMPTLEPANLPVSLVLEELEAKRSQFSSLSAAGSLRVEGGKHSWSGRAFILSRIPQSLRLEVLNFFGQPALYLTSDGNHFLFWEPGSDHAYKGFTKGNTLHSLINFPLEDRKTLPLLAGIVPAYDYQEAKLFKVQGTGNLVLQLQEAAGRKSQWVWLEAEEFAVNRIERRRGSSVELEASFADFVAIGGSVYPRRVSLKADKVEISLNYKKLAINQPLQEEAFQLVLPEGIKILPW